MDHPTILKIYDAFIENKNLYIVTDFANGGDLHQMIKEKYIKK